MRNLIAKTALQGQLPITANGLTLAEVDLGQITSIAAFPGQLAAVDAALGGFPAPNRLLDGPLRVWTGPDQCFLIGQDAPNLSAAAATTDQSGGWAALSLTGPGADQALMRLYPLDLRLQSFPVGHAARAPLGHMQSVLMRRDEAGFVLLVFRSMARTAWAELAEVLHHIEARAKASV